MDTLIISMGTRRYMQGERRKFGKPELSKMFIEHGIPTKKNL